jgi:hypothetical protein
MGLARQVRRASEIRKPRTTPKATTNAERLVSAAIVRDGQTKHGLRSHYELRASLGDDDPKVSRPGDIEGFLTDQGRFVDRWAARDVAVIAGQAMAASRPLLSSDINW